MSYEDEHIAALQGIHNALRALLVQTKLAEAAKLQRHTQLLATLRTLKPKEGE